mmetsp:Transcript_27278/g.57572  ORF Transcript_27278/g.57572 Transcript_27278/m.57572 type:complete len:182 (-) Transcript_27278:227-772(-)
MLHVLLGLSLPFHTWPRQDYAPRHVHKATSYHASNSPHLICADATFDPPNDWEIEWLHPNPVSLSVRTLRVFGRVQLYSHAAFDKGSRPLIDGVSIFTTRVAVFNVYHPPCPFRVFNFTLAYQYSLLFCCIARQGGVILVRAIICATRECIGTVIFAATFVAAACFRYRRRSSFGRFGFFG